jgi:ABC-type dipeptide/oligopeptide/nickel transport system permease component
VIVMLRLVLKRLVLAVPSLIGVVIVTFLLTRALPGDPAAYFAGPAASREAIEQIRVKLGLDQPLYVQFLRYLQDLVRGDLGNLLTTGQPVTTEIRTRLPASAELTLLGLIASVTIAVPLGIVAATRPNSLIDHACRVVATAGVSLPVFFTGLILVYVFYYLAGWAPAPLGRLDIFYSPPPHVTGFYLIDSTLAGDGEVFIASLKMVFSFLLGANVLVEKVFAWPGIGSFAVEALIASDFAPLQGFVLTMAVMYVVLNLVIDILYGVIDPRVRIEA